MNGVTRCPVCSAYCSTDIEPLEFKRARFTKKCKNTACGYVFSFIDLISNRSLDKWKIKKVYTDLRHKKPKQHWGIR
jgi:hypothetical protein